MTPATVGFSPQDGILCDLATECNGLMIRYRLVAVLDDKVGRLPGPATAGPAKPGSDDPAELPWRCGSCRSATGHRCGPWNCCDQHSPAPDGRDQIRRFGSRFVHAVVPTDQSQDLTLHFCCLQISRGRGQRPGLLPFSPSTPPISEPAPRRPSTWPGRSRPPPPPASHRCGSR